MNWKNLFDSKILERGHSYFKNNAVEELEVYDGSITATVIGSEDYDVELAIENGDITEMECSCPYSAEGYACKHMAAALYAYEALGRTPKKPKERRLSPEELIAQADERTIREFLLGAIKNDKKLLLDLRMAVGRSAGIPDMKLYRQKIRSVISGNSDRYGYIDYQSADGFIDEMLELLHNDIEKLSGAYLQEAFELSGYLFLEVSAVEIDDSDGGLTEFGNAVADTWSGMIRAADNALQKKMFTWFTDHLDGSVNDYMEEFIENTVFDNFDGQEFLLQKIKLVDQRLSLPGDGSYSDEYRKGHLVRRRTDVMKQMGMSSEEIVQFCRRYYELRSARELIVDMYEEAGRYDEAIAVLNGSLELDSEYRGCIEDIHERLMKLYKITGNTEEYHRQLWILTTEFFSMEYYRELKSLHKEDWEQVFEELVKVADQGIIPRLYAEEKLYDRLFEFVNEHFSMFILETYEDIFAKHYPEYILEKYAKMLENAARNTAPRSTYSEWAARLNKMAKWHGGKECVREIVGRWRTVYKNRPAMLEELRRVKV